LARTVGVAVPDQLDAQEMALRRVAGVVVAGKPLNDATYRGLRIKPDDVKGLQPPLRRVRTNRMDEFDYAAPADLFPARSKTGHRPVGYRRFDTAAEAIRFAMEEMSADFLHGTVMESESQRFDGAGIRQLYASELYPLAKKQA